MFFLSSKLSIFLSFFGLIYCRSFIKLVTSSFQDEYNSIILGSTREITTNNEMKSKSRIEIYFLFKLFPSYLQSEKSPLLISIYLKLLFLLLLNIYDSKIFKLVKKKKKLHLKYSNFIIYFRYIYI